MLKVRASSLTGYPDCARRTAAGIFPEAIRAAGYTLRQLPQNIGAAIGTAVHDGAAHSLRLKMSTHEIGTDREALDVALANLETAFEDDLLMDANTVNKDDAVKQTGSLLGALRKYAIPAVNPIMVEERLEATVGNIVLSGQVDTGQVEGILDWKTGTHQPHPLNQLCGNVLLARTHGKGSEKGTMVWAPRVKPGKEQPMPVAVQYDMVAAEHTALAVTKRIGRDFEEFQASGERHAFMANPSSMLCSPKFCSSWGTDFCKEHQKH